MVGDEEGRIGGHARSSPFETNVTEEGTINGSSDNGGSSTLTLVVDRVEASSTVIRKIGLHVSLVHLG